MTRRGRKNTDKLGNTYFITTTVVNFSDILTSNDRFPALILKSLKYYLIQYKSILIAYVIMPNHVHFIVQTNEGESISDFMRDFKKYTSKELYKLAKAQSDSELIIQLQMNSDIGGGKLWMDRYDSKIIVSEKFLKQKINYIHNNPVRAGLVENATDWIYSSGRNYYYEDNSLIEVYTDMVDLRF